MKNFCLLFLLLAASACQAPLKENDIVAAKKEWAMVIHGGAGTPKFLNPEDEKVYHEALAEALNIGTEILIKGGSSLDAVEKTIIYLENNPLFNAGKGAVINSEGIHELDAAFADGATMGIGSLAGITTVKNPISLARLVMEKSQHVFIAGVGAEKFADEMGVERVENSYFTTEKRLEGWKKQKAKMDSAIAYSPDEIIGYSRGTVGAVALDKNGNIAAGTSTGGMSMKKPGRVGDAPVIGSGTYANSLVGISATGSGEEFIRRVVAYDVAALMEYGGLSLEEATHRVIFEKMPTNMGGIIALDSLGNIAMPFNTSGMFRAAADSEGRLETGVFK